MTNKISGESFFTPLPKNHVLLEKNFVPLPQSVVWRYNGFFWKHTDLWEKLYGEHYEKSLPRGVSSSHEPEFIKKSALRFFQFLLELEKQNLLPDKIIILEQGPGSGLYAKRFLDQIKFLSDTKNPFYKKMLYVLTDTSEELLKKCQSLLAAHQSLIEVYLQNSTHDLPQKYFGKVLFARHGNFWDQLPCRLFRKKDGRLYEVYVRAVTDKQFTTNKVLGSITWKPFIRCLKLETKDAPPLQKNLEKFKDYPDNCEIIDSQEVILNLSLYLKLIDWQRGGYLEVVDLIVATPEGFLKDRRPKKYDGALAVPVNGFQIKEYLFSKQKHLSLTPVRGINSVATILNHDLKTLFLHESFVRFAEIAARKEQTEEEILAKAKQLYSYGTDIVAFSDQAHAGREFFSITEIVNMGILSRLPQGAILPIVAVRRKSPAEINEILQKSRERKLSNMFVLGGDPAPDLDKNTLSWKEVLPLVRNKFYCGAVCHPDVLDIKNTLEKINLGAKFLIVQACYDDDKWLEWLKAVREKRLYEMTKLVPVIIPVITRKSLEVLKLLPDVFVSSDFLSYWNSLNDEEIRQKGISMARAMIENYKNEGIFSGVYLYSKSTEVIKEIFK